MNRRAFVTGLGAVLAAPFAAGAQQAERVYRLGYLILNPLQVTHGVRSTAFLDRLRKGLRDLGYLEGRNIVIEVRSAEGEPDRLPNLAADLVRRKVDLIVTETGSAAVAAKKVTQTVPIVMIGSGDAVRQGLATSLARPGGNVTGLTMISPELSRKRLELLREMLPKLSHVGVLSCDIVGAVNAQEWMETKAAADALGMRLSSLEAHGREDLATAFVSAGAQRVQALLGFDCPVFIPSAALIADLSVKHRLPAMYPFPAYPRVGNLMSYGASIEDAPYRAATYVDRILKGAKPADLPIEQPTKFELVINLKTAKALGLTIPPEVLARADVVIHP